MRGFVTFLLSAAVAAPIFLTAAPASATTVGPSASPTPTAATPTAATPTAKQNPSSARELRVATVTPDPGKYGIATVIRVQFDRDVPNAARATVLSKISVSASRPIGSAGWAWYGNQTAVFRPEKFWPARTSVAVSASPDGTPLPGSNLIWAGEAQRSFVIGRSQVIRVSARTHRAVVVRDGKAIRTMGVSLGMPGWVTRSGIKVLADGYRFRIMTGESIGAEDYTLRVPYAIRLTDTGEFIHGAPWAVARIGRYNGSHGCTNLTVADARWVYRNYLIGDPVITSGTKRPMEPWNGGGGPWNLNWANWTAARTDGGTPAPPTTPSPSITPLPPITPIPPITPLPSTSAVPSISPVPSTSKAPTTAAPATGSAPAVVPTTATIAPASPKPSATRN